MTVNTNRMQRISRVAGAMLCALLLVLSAAPQAFAAPAPFDFKGVKWNSAPAEVEKSHKAKPEKKEQAGDDQYLLYQDRFADKDISVDYNFKREKLAVVNLMFHSMHKNPQDYLAEYDQVTGAMEAKYGARKSRTIYDKNGKPLEPSPDLAEKIGKGEASIVTLWELPDTSIMQNITGDESLYAHDVSFWNKNQLIKDAMPPYEKTSEKSSDNKPTNMGK